MTSEAPLVIENREELVFLLSEASALEHMVMCEYLFAVFSLKSHTSEGVTPEQLAAINSWERIITHVATEEMLHLALVSNLLSSVGAIPFFMHPNFPCTSKYYPAGIQLALLPFGQHALQHFLYLERPEGIDLEDAPEFQVLAVSDSAPFAEIHQIVPHTQNFMTVGHLYRSIEQGFRNLVEKYGEKQIFLNASGIQASQKHFGWPQLISVVDLESAMRALETIVEQGEGASGDWRNAHYGKFVQIVQDYQKFKAQDPTFEPARPVTAAFVHPTDNTDSNGIFITDSLTAGTSELFNASYEVMLQVLIRYFMHATETEEEQKILSQVALDMMFDVISPLGKLLTRLPIGLNLPGKTAGPSFEIYRTGYFLPQQRAAWVILHERLLELAVYVKNLSAQSSVIVQDLLAVEEGLRKLAVSMESYINSLALRKRA
jgi:hypothetical protein